MARRLRYKLSYANVMATIAVFTALSGTSYAALTITGKSVKNESLTGADVKNRSLGAAELSSSARKQLGSGSGAGTSGPAGPAGPAGPTGQTGQTGQTGAAGVAKAFARVSADGTLTSTGGSISVTRAGTSSYCISGLGFTPKSVITTAAFGDSITNGTFVVDLGSGGAFTGCPMNTQAYVTTFDASNAIPNSFFLLVN